MRTLQENDELFINLMKLNTTFYWNGHVLELKGDHIRVYTEEALKDLRNHVSENFHNKIKLQLK